MHHIHPLPNHPPINTLLSLIPQNHLLQYPEPKPLIKPHIILPRALEVNRLLRAHVVEDIRHDLSAETPGLETGMHGDDFEVPQVVVCGVLETGFCGVVGGH